MPALRAAPPEDTMYLAPDKKFDHILMAMETSITKEGVSYKEIQGTPEEQRERGVL